MNWSLSKLGTYEKCAFQYKERYINKVPSPPSPAAQRGLDMHKVMELYVKGELDELLPKLEFYKPFLDGLRNDPECTLFPEYQVAMTDEWKPTPWDAPEGVWWKGVLDLLVKHPRRLAWYDWKTGKIYADHEDQKQIYTIAALEHYPEYDEVDAYHVYLDSGEQTLKTFHRDQLGSMKVSFKSRVEHMQRDTEFIPNPGFHCRYCPYSKSKGGNCRF